jgi:hypothetical protein
MAREGLDDAHLCAIGCGSAGDDPVTTSRKGKDKPCTTSQYNREANEPYSASAENGKKTRGNK